ncbi:hypothetical protein CsatB_021890 [Cannabis sativa]
MKISSHLLLLLLFSVELLGFLSEGMVRIPEHTCQKVVKLTKCGDESCNEECSKLEPSGFGVCKNGLICFCTYYCKQPPLLN